MQRGLARAPLARATTTHRAACHQHAPCAAFVPSQLAVSLPSYSRHLHRLPRIEDAASRDPKRPGTLERTLDCVSADTPQVLWQVASEHEKLQAEVAELRLEKTRRNRLHREQKRINRQGKNNGKALEVVGEAIMVLSRVVPMLRALPKIRADTLSMHVLCCLYEALASALWLTRCRQVETDEDDFTQPPTMRVCGISAGLDIISGTAHSVIQIAQKLAAMHDMTTVDAEDMLPGMLHTLSNLLDTARIITKRRLMEAKDMHILSVRECSSAAVSRSIDRA